MGANLSNAVDVMTEALSDGAMHEGIGAPTNPNFHLGCRDNAGIGAGCKQFRPRTLDEVLMAWPGFTQHDSVDFMRIKAAGSEALIIMGLQKHLAAARVRLLLVTTREHQAELI